MTVISSNELKQIAVEILIDFHKVCKLNDINYSIGYGTLLGAVRHKGFIPWDDDIDVIMARDDFEKFKQIRSHLSSKYEFVSVDTDEKYTAPLAKIYDKTTKLYELGHKDNFMLGVYIDVFVLDYIPENIFLRKLIEYRSLFFRKLWGLATYSPKSGLWLEKYIRKISLKLNLGRLASIANNLISRRSAKTGLLGNLQYSSYGLQKDNFPIEKVMKTRDISFEGTIVRAVEDTDYFLKLWYGNYMELPPIDKRVTHHNFVAYR